MNPKPHHLKINKTLGLVCLTILSAVSAQAVDRFWSGATDSYTNTTWTGGIVPGGGDNAIVNNGATVLINPGNPNWTVNDIRAGDGTGNTGAWIQDGPTVTLNGWFRLAIGSGSSGTYNFLSGTIQNNGRHIVGEGGTSTFWQTNTTPNNTLNVGGELWCGNGGTGNGTINLGGNGQMTVNNWLAIGRDGSTGVFNLSGNANLRKQGGGNLTFAGLTGATANGTLNQTGGTVTNETTETWLSEDGVGVWNMSAGSASLGLLQFGRNASANGTFNLNGGVLAVNQITKGGGLGTLNFNGGTLRARTTLANFMSGASGVLQAGGAVIDSQGFNIGISAVLSDGAGGSLTKIGNGTLTLSGANTYLGATIVSGGKLIEDTASLVTSAVTVANTAGYGVNLSVSGTQVIHGNVTLSGAANTLDFLLGGFGNPTLAPLNVTSVLSVNGTTTVNIFDTLPQVGPIPLVSFVSRTGTGRFVLGTLPAGVSASIRTNTTDYANPTIELVISSTALIRWDGQVAGADWDINTTTNWTDYLSALPAKFTTGAAVFFDDRALGLPTANLNIAVSPGSVTVTNDTLAYTIAGTGSINGAGGLAKQGIGTLTIATTNGYSGPTVISGGTVSITKLADSGLPSAIGTAASFALDGGTLSYTGPAVVTDRGYSITGNSTLDAQSDMTFNGVIAPSAGANFSKTGNGTLFVKRTGANTLAAGGGGGTYNIVSGTVIMDGSAGPQVNTITGEIWPGAGATSTGGSLILTNTTLNLSSWLAIARGTGPGGYTSSVALYNSSLRSVNGSMCYDNNIAGTLQTGLLTLNGTSTYTNNGDGNYGESAGAQATITLKDSSVLFNNNRMMVGWHQGASGAGTGVVTVANSAKIVVNAWLSIGNEGGVGSVLVKDNGSLVVASDLNVCDVNAGTGDLVVQDNTLITANNMFIGKGAASVGTYTISGNSTNYSNNGITLASGDVASVGTVNLNGGSLAVNLVQGLPGSGYFNFNGGKLIAHPPYFGPDFLFGLAAATVQPGGAVIQIDNSDVRGISQALQDDGSGIGGLTKLGTGTLLLNGANTYLGSTTVSAGGLGGSGTIAGSVNVSATGTLAPSASAGINTLTISGNLAIAGSIAVAVNTTNTPATNDFVQVTGTRNRTGTGSVTVANLGPALSIGDRFVLFNGAVTGAGTMAVTGGGVTWKNDLGTDGSITVLTILAPPNVTAVSVLPNGNVNLTATGSIGSSYTLLGTTNLVTPRASWQVIATGTVTASPFNVTDTTASGSAQKFYIFSTP